MKICWWRVSLRSCLHCCDGILSLIGTISGNILDYFEDFDSLSVA